MHQPYLPIAMFLIALVTRFSVADELRVADVFTDHAVLQQGVKLPIWGTAIAYEKVTLRFAGQTKSVQASKDGLWRIELSPLQAEKTGTTMTVESGDDRIKLHNLLVGEVWYASGQSNMQMTLSACAKKISVFGEMIDSASTNNIRWLRVDETDSPKPLTKRQSATGWQLDHPTNRSKQSAVAYVFALELCEVLDVPIGIIETSWGGKPIEGFIPRRQFVKQEPLKSILSLTEQNRLDELSSLKGGLIIRNTAGMPGRIFNARVSPIAPYALRGFIWYQGESNAGRGEDPRDYRIKMRALIDGWRETWDRPELPFYFVQLPAFKDEASGWVRLREEQRLSLDVEHTGMAVAIDLRDSDIHPTNKLDVGKRLASWAIAKTYKKKSPASGPLFQSVTVDGDSMRVTFEHSESGLMVARKDGLGGPEPTPGYELEHFELADESGNWHSAQATIDGAEVVVRCPDVPKPCAVRYACSGAPANANLYNQAGLPASPFCSNLQLLPWKSEN